MSLYNYASPQQHQTAYPPQPGPNPPASGLTSGTIIAANTGPYTIANSGVQTGLNITGSISSSSTVHASDVLLDGVSVKESLATLAKINERLAILVPDPSKLEKFAALKAAYADYLLLEKLCTDA
jgi:hypothetical protein